MAQHAKNSIIKTLHKFSFSKMGGPKTIFIISIQMVMDLHAIGTQKFIERLSDSVKLTNQIIRTLSKKNAKYFESLL